MSDEKQQQQPKQGPTRIPVTKIWLREGETIDLPGGNSLMGRIDVEPSKVPGRQFFRAHFVPAHQVVELEWFKNENTEPHLMRLPVANLKRFD